MGHLNTKEACSIGWRKQNVECKRWKGLSGQMREILEQGYSECGSQGDTRSYKLPTEFERKHLKLLEQFDRVIICLLNLITDFLIGPAFFMFFISLLLHCLLYFQKSVHSGLQTKNYSVTINRNRVP